MKEAYLDNSATTQTCPEAVEKIVELLTVRYGNPSSLHKKGIEAEKEIRLARQIIADYLSCDTSEVYFTSGGTESNNLAILGTVRALKRRGNRIVTTSIEHSSVIETFKEAEKLGFETVFIEPDRNGLVPEDKIYNAIVSEIEISDHFREVTKMMRFVPFQQEASQKFIILRKGAVRKRSVIANQRARWCGNPPDFQTSWP